MPIQTIKTIEAHAKLDPRAHVTVELPVFGVGLGRVTQDSAWILINNRLPYGEPDRIVIVPVLRVPQHPAKWRHVRSSAPGVESKPSAEDIEQRTIILIPLPEEDGPLRIPGTEQDAHRSKSSQRAAQAPRQPLPQNLDRTLRQVRQNVILEVGRNLWIEAAEGLLFMLLFGPVAEETHSDIAQAIARILDTEDISRCVVPSRAITSLTQLDIANTLSAPAPFCFALASCQYTAGMVDSTPPLDGFERFKVGPADRSYARLAQRYLAGDGALRPELLLLAGDQVYVDATAGLFDPSTVDGRFLRPYEQFYGSAYVQHVTRQIPVAMMLDDHELRDNWENEADAQADLELGRNAYLDFQRDGGPLDSRMPQAKDANVSFVVLRPNLYAPADKQCWAELHYQGYGFFICDTRTERQKRTAGAYEDKTIMSERQFNALSRWLSDKNSDNRPRFIVSPSVLIPRRLTTAGVGAGVSLISSPAVLHSDAWDGYPCSFKAIFNLIADKAIRNVIFLSGDEHLCCVATAVLRGRPATEPVVIHSIHSSGLYTPYVFANAIEEDFVASEELVIPGAKADDESSTWDVNTTFAPRGQGFALLRVAPIESGKWRLQVKFSLHRGAKEELDQNVNYEFELLGYGNRKSNAGHTPDN
jgi:hypothetical protein